MTTPDPTVHAEALPLTPAEQAELNEVTVDIQQQTTTGSSFDSYLRQVAVLLADTKTLAKRYSTLAAWLDYPVLILSLLNGSTTLSTFFTVDNSIARIGSVILSVGASVLYAIDKNVDAKSKAAEATALVDQLENLKLQMLDARASKDLVAQETLKQKFIAIQATIP